MSQTENTVKSVAIIDRLTCVLFFLNLSYIVLMQRNPLSALIPLPVVYRWSSDKQDVHGHRVNDSSPLISLYYIIQCVYNL